MNELDEILDLKGKVSKKAKYEIIEPNEEEPPQKEEKDYIIRNGKKYYKCDKSYVYKCEDGFFAYRIVHKESKTNTFVTKDIQTKEKFRTETQAYKSQQEHLYQLKKDKTFKNRNVTFDEVWQYIKDNSAKDKSTLMRYESIYKHHVKDEFGYTAIQDITYISINDFLENMYKKGDGKGSKQKGYSHSYVSSMLKFFWLVLNTAFALQSISSDDLKRVLDNIHTPLRLEDDEENVRVLTRAETNKIYDLIKDTDFLLPVLISLYTGARPGEAFAVRFSDFDYKNNTVSINKQIVEKPDGMLYIEEVKTFSRTVKVPSFLIQKAKEREEQIKQARSDNPTLFEANRKRVIYLLNKANEMNYIYDDMTSIDTKGRYNYLSSFGYYTKIIKKDICPHEDGKEDFSFYSFRKTALSNFASHNIPINALMKITGHTKPDTLYKYYYSIENEFAQEKIAETVKAFDCLIEE